MSAAPATPGFTPIGPALAELLAWLWPALDALPGDVIDRARRLWLDTASCALSGLQAEAPQRWLQATAQGDAGLVPLPGTAQTLSASSAAVALALGACWDEACEGHALAHGRPGVPVVAALWSRLPLQPVSWQQLWQATVAGYEVAARLGAWLRIPPGLHVDGVWSAFGAAAAVVRLAGGDAQQALRALDAAATQLPYSLLRPVRQGANLRNLYLGHSAWLGVQAALAVRAGLTAPTGAIDDFAAQALPGAPAGTWVPAGRWLLLDSYWKPFAAVRHVHYGAQAALALRTAGLPLQAVDGVTLRVYPEALHYCANRAPATPIAAQFSLSFGVAAALRFGDLSPAEFRPPRFDDAELRRLEALVRIEPYASTFPAPRRGAVLVVEAAGQSWQHRQDGVTGDAGHEPDDAAVQAKFDRYTGGDAAMAAWAHAVRHDDLQALAGLPDMTRD